MSQLPSIPLTPEDQRRLAVQLYARMEDQVKSYNARRGVVSTSVTTETAKELMDSMVYTLEAAGGYVPGLDVKVLLTKGQQVLEDKLARAKQILRLVEASAPIFQTRYYGDALRTLWRYLETYDHLHLAHKTPEGLDYPLLIPVPEQFRGIDRALCYLNCLWMENEILHRFSPEALAELTDAAPPDYWFPPQKQCEQVLWNAMARTVLGKVPEPLLLEDGEAEDLFYLLQNREREDLHALFTEALNRLALPTCAVGAVDSLLPRLMAVLPHGNLSQLFW